MATAHAGSSRKEQNVVIAAVLSYLVLILMRSPAWLVEKVSLINSHDNSVLGLKETWAVPVTMWVGGSFYCWSYLIFCLCSCAILYFIFAQRHRLSSFGITMLIVGTALSLRPEHLIAVLILGVISLLPSKSAARDVSLLLLMMIIAVLATIEFGVIFGVLLTLLMSHLPDPRRRVAKIGLLFAIIALLVGLSLFQPGFGRALLRPLSWINNQYAKQLIPGLDTPWSASHPVIGHCLLLGVTCELLWRHGTSPGNWPLKGVSLLLGGLAFSTGWYTVLATFALFALPLRTESRKPMSRITVILGLALSTAMCVAWHFQRNGPGAITGGYDDGLVTTTDWTVDGRVLLLDLSHTQHWSPPNVSGKFELMLTDRWDAATAGTFENYAQQCRKIRQGKQELFLSPSGPTDGFAGFLRDYDIRFIVADARELDLIRMLSVTPKWGLVAVDSTRAIFGTNPTQRNKALQLFYYLEWPHANFRGDFEGIIALGNSRDTCVVSEVLNTIRFPYAALRLLSGERSSCAAIVRTHCYTELAHRALRQTGTVSLLDHPRAIRGLSSKMDGTFDDFLGERRHAHALYAQLTEGDTKYQSASWTDTEQRIRDDVFVGNLESALTRLDDRGLSGDHKAFYRTLLTKNSAQQMKSELSRLLPNLPQHLEVEAWFYLGCLELEGDDSASAAQSFQQCLAQSPSGAPIRSLAKLYLAGLTRK